MFALSDVEAFAGISSQISFNDFHREFSELALWKRLCGQWLKAPLPLRLGLHVETRFVRLRVLRFQLVAIRVRFEGFLWLFWILVRLL
jgi:hypothetical protein